MEPLFILLAAALISWLLAERKAGLAARLLTGLTLATVAAWVGAFFASVVPSHDRRFYRSSLLRIERLLASGRSDEVLRAIRAANPENNERGALTRRLWQELPREENSH